LLNPSPPGAGREEGEGAPIGNMGKVYQMVPVCTIAFSFLSGRRAIAKGAGGVLNFFAVCLILVAKGESRLRAVI
jgi:hypothetical protein